MYFFNILLTLTLTLTLISIDKQNIKLDATGVLIHDAKHAITSQLAEHSPVILTTNNSLSLATLIVKPVTLSISSLVENVIYNM